jgi:hypothetical protein
MILLALVTEPQLTQCQDEDLARGKPGAVAVVCKVVCWRLLLCSL